MKQTQILFDDRITVRTDEPMAASNEERFPRKVQWLFAKKSGVAVGALHDFGLAPRE